MFIIVPVDVKYKGEKKKAHTKFSCDQADFKKFQAQGAWIVQPADTKKGNKNNV